MAHSFLHRETSFPPSPPKHVSELRHLPCLRLIFFFAADVCQFDLLSASTLRGLLVIIISTFLCTCADAIVLGVIWSRTSRQWRTARHLKIAMSLTSCLLRNGKLSLEPVFPTLTNLYRRCVLRVRLCAPALLEVLTILSRAVLLFRFVKILTMYNVRCPFFLHKCLCMLTGGTQKLPAQLNQLSAIMVISLKTHYKSDV